MTSLFSPYYITFYDSIVFFACSVVSVDFWGLNPFCDSIVLSFAQLSLLTFACSATTRFSFSSSSVYHCMYCLWQPHSSMYVYRIIRWYPLEEASELPTLISSHCPPWSSFSSFVFSASVFSSSCLIRYVSCKWNSLLAPAVLLHRADKVTVPLHSASKHLKAIKRRD